MPSTVHHADECGASPELLFYCTNEETIQEPNCRIEARTVELPRVGVYGPHGHEKACLRTNVLT